MKIYIPSLGRADQRHHTFDVLPAAWQERAVMVVPWTDNDDYVERFGVLNVMGCASKGIGAVRQRIIGWEDGPVLMLDDDLSFFVRRKDDPTKLIKASPRDVSKMLERVEAKLKDYAHVSIATREGANRNTDEYLFNQRCLRALGYDASVLKKERVRFDRLPVMEDFDVALQLLRLGYQSVTLNEWCQDQGQSNAPGGCSTYRSLKVQAKGAEGLKRLHPDFVTVVTKNAKSKDAWAERRDVRVQWKKAYEEGLRHASR